MLKRLLLVGVLAISLASNSAMATTLKGKVSISKAYLEAYAAQLSQEEEASGSYFWKEPNGIISVDPPNIDYARDIAVVIEKKGGDKPGPDDIKTIRVHFATADRRVIVTRPGSTIRFLNVSAGDHELYAPDLPDFGPEKQTQNGFRPVSFKSEGIFEVRCRLSPSFSTFVLVTAATYVIDTIKQDGSFELPDLDDGMYSVSVFHRGQWVHKKKVTIDGEREKSVRLKLKPAEGK